MFPRPGATAPEIRFDGFSGDWQTSAFSDVFTPLKNNTLSRACLNYESGMIKNIHYGDVLIKFDSVVDVNNVSSTKIIKRESADYHRRVQD